MENEKSSHFTDEEVTVLVDMYTKNFELLKGQFKGSGGACIKNRKWMEILEAVNAVRKPDTKRRTLGQIKKKWTNLKQPTKSKASANNSSFRKTGGGPNEDNELSSNEAKILSTISSRQISGIPGGFDVHEKTVLTIDTTLASERIGTIN